MNPVCIAVRLTSSVDTSGYPIAAAWNLAPAIRFDHDWQGKMPDSDRSTEVRVLYQRDTLFLRFDCKYRSLFLYPDARADGWRDGLWDRDVAEAFLQPDCTDPLKYKEFEVAPNGFWIDLSISHGTKEELGSGLRRQVVLDEAAKSWRAELAIPMKTLTPSFNKSDSWRANFYRVEGKTEPRFYSAWSPTYTQEPNFHVPECFGTLQFRDTL